MTRLFAKVTIMTTVVSVLSSSPMVAQILPPAKQADHVKIIKGPALELALDDLAIVRWTSTNPRGNDEHFGVVHYGTNPSDLSQTAKSHIRLNRTHPETIFRVRIPGSETAHDLLLLGDLNGANGKSDGVKSAVTQFTTPARNQRIVVNP